MTLLAVAPDKFSPGLRDDGYAYREDPKTHAQYKIDHVPFEYTLTALDRALDDSYPSDAHFVAYVLLQGGRPCRRQPRINKLGLPWIEAQGYRVDLECLIADIDNLVPVLGQIKPLHLPWASLDVARAAAERACTLADTAGVYVTKQGLRLVQPLKRRIDVAQAEGTLMAWLADLAARGLTPDPKCTDWTRHFRAPNVRRDGKPYRCPIRFYDRLNPIEPPLAAFEPRAHGKRAPRVAGPVPIAARLAPELQELVGALAAPLRAGGYQGDRHVIGLHLAGALLGNRRVDAAQVPALVAEVSRAAGWDAWHHHASAVDTVHRWAAGHRVSGLADLRRLAAPAAAALENATDVHRAELATRAAPMPDSLPPLAESTERLYHTIHDAPEGVTVVKTPCGFGKTATARRVAIERARRGGAHKPNTKTGLVVPTNELAQQVTTDIRAEGLAVLRVFGPLSVAGDYDGYECRFRAAGAALADGGQSVGRLYCKACDYQRECRAVEGAEGPTDARIVVGPHALLPEVDELVGKTGLLFIDEPPSVLEDELFSRDDLLLAELHLHEHFERRYAVCLAPALRAILVWLEHEQPDRLEQPGPVARALDLGVDADLIDRAFEATGLDDAGELVRVALDADTDPPPIDKRSAIASMRAPGLAARLGKASKVLRAVRRAFLRPRVVATLYEREGGRVLAITGLWRPLEHALQREGRCVVAAADADLYLRAYRDVLGYDPAFHAFDAPDGAPIARTWLHVQASRSRWCTGDLGPVDAATRAAAAWALEDVSTRTVGVVTFKSLAPSIRKTLEAAAPGIQWRVSWFGAIRGLDAWKDSDALITLGDPRPNVDAVARELAFLGADSGEDARRLYSDARAAADLEQGQGRLRTIHRKRPGRALHVGAVLPGGWRQPIEIRRIEAGRPARPPVSNVAQLVDVVGGQRAAARVVKKDPRAVRQWLAGEGTPQASDVALLQAAASERQRTTEHVLSEDVIPIRGSIRGITSSGSTMIQGAEDETGDVEEAAE